MALPPTIPTSFVPHTTAATQRRYKFDFIGVLNAAMYFVFVVTIALAAAVFFYEQMLTSQHESARKELVAQQGKITKEVAQDLVRLNNRLTSATLLLNNHVALTRFFGALEKILPTNVRFSALHVTVAEGGKVTVDGTGTAKNFNALAAASASFASNGEIKDTIFSHLSINKDNSVSFGISATVDPALVTFTGEGAVAEPIPAAPTTATTTTP